MEADGTPIDTGLRKFGALHGDHTDIGCNTVLNRGSISAIEMLKLLDRTTSSVLFFEMGQGHEEWFKESIAGWDPDRIERWLKDNTTFKKIYRLGTDTDNVAPYANNYGRTLFACLR